MTPRILEFYLHALQFIMGDLDGTTTPSNRFTPAVAARESLGWRLALTAQEPEPISVLEMIDRARRSGLAHIQPSSVQQVGGADSVPFDSRLSDEQLESIRLAPSPLSSLRDEDVTANVDRGDLQALLAELHRRGIRPTVLGLADTSVVTRQSNGVPQTIDAIDVIVDRILREGHEHQSR